MHSVLKSPGYWLAAVMAASQFVNALRAFVDPIGFATYMGLPLVAQQDIGFVQVYGLRALFIALLVGVFLYLRNMQALQWTAIAALVMPLGDVLLTINADATTATITRHLLILSVVAATAWLIYRWRARQAPDAQDP